MGFVFLVLGEDGAVVPRQEESLFEAPGNAPFKADRGADATDRETRFENWDAMVQA